MPEPNTTNFTKADIVNKFAIEYGDGSSTDTLNLLKEWFDEAFWDLTVQLGIKSITSIANIYLPAGAYFLLLDWGYAKILNVYDATNNNRLRQKSYREVLEGLSSGSLEHTTTSSQSTTTRTTEWLADYDEEPAEFAVVNIPVGVVVTANQEFHEGIPSCWAEIKTYIPEQSPVLFDRRILFNKKLSENTLYNIHYVIGEGSALPDTFEIFFPVQAISILKESLRLLAYRHEDESDKIRITFASREDKIKRYRREFSCGEEAKFGGRVGTDRRIYEENPFVKTPIVDD